MTPVELRTAGWMAPAYLTLGLFTLAMNLVLGEGFGMFFGAFLVVMGLLALNGVLVVVEPHQVRIKNPFRMTIRRRPIAGLADLRIDGTRLIRVSDGRKVAGIGPAAVRPDDVAALRAAIEQCGGVAL